MSSRVDLEHIRRNIVGLDDDVQTVLLALSQGIPVMLEGEARTRKTELAKTMAVALDRPFHRVDGNQELTAIKLQGWFDPPLVLERGYGWDTFVPGPLAQTTLDGGVFFFNEVTRGPSETINGIDCIGRACASDTSPRGARGWGRISLYIHLRSNGADSRQPTAAGFLRSVCTDPFGAPASRAGCAGCSITHWGKGETLIRTVCQIILAARQQCDMEHGASVRAAVHMTGLASVLRDGGGDPYNLASLIRVTVAVLAQSIRPTCDSTGSPEQLIQEIVEHVMGNVQRPEPQEVPEPAKPDYHSRFTALARSMLQAGDAKGLAQLSDKNRHLVGVVTSAEQIAACFWWTSQQCIEVDPIQTGVSSVAKEVTIGDGRPTVLIGERINPTGRQGLAAALEAGELEPLRKEALAQVRAGADIADVSVGVAGLDEAKLLPQAVQAVMETVDVPLCLDSGHPKNLEAAIGVYRGRPLVNSVNGEERSLAEILPLVKEHGATVIDLTMDDQGIPSDADRRADIAHKIVEHAEALGISRQDVMIHCLALTVEADSEAGLVTLEAIRRVKAELGVNLTLGCSNVSFGLPDRELLNCAFLIIAIAAGVNCPVVDVAQMRSIVLAANSILGRDKYAKRYAEAYRQRQKCYGAWKHARETNIGICSMRGVPQPVKETPSCGQESSHVRR